MTSYEPINYSTGELPPDPAAGQPTIAITGDFPAADQSSSPETSAKEKVAQSAKAGQDAATEVAHTAADKAQEVAAEAKQQARNLLGEAREQLRDHAGDQHRNAVSNLRSLAEELDSMARSSQSGGVATDLVGQAADRAHGVATWLEDRQPGDLVNELRRFARRRPAAFLAGAVVAGVLAGRLGRGAVAVHTDDDQEAVGSTNGRSEFAGRSGQPATSGIPATADAELFGAPSESGPTLALPEQGFAQSAAPGVPR